MNQIITLVPFLVSKRNDDIRYFLRYLYVYKLYTARNTEMKHKSIIFLECKKKKKKRCQGRDKVKLSDANGNNPIISQTGHNPI